MNISAIERIDMMTERLRTIIQQLEDLPAEEQNLLAEQIADLLLPQIDKETYIGSIPDLPDDAEDILLQWRREVPPTSPIEEQLRWLEEEDE
jgi:hypothetical protein